MKRHFSFLSVFVFIFICPSFFIFAQKTDFASYVNPMIGTDGTGHTFPGATVPYGMVQLSPDTRIDGSWEGCSGYHYSDTKIYGFSHTHLSGTGVSDYGDILLLPSMNELSFDPKAYATSFSHTNEMASAGFYQVTFDNLIKVRLTVSTRVGFHEYTFPRTGNAHVLLDLRHRDELLESDIIKVNDRTFYVKRRSKAWADNQHCYAKIEFDTPMQISKTLLNKEHTQKVALVFTKKVKKGQKINVKVSLSQTGFEGAERNSIEVPHWNFEKVKKEAESLWNAELSKIQIQTDDKDKRTVFYTALYHTMIHPNIAQDIDGKYRGRDMNIHQAEGFDYYTVFSLWDTFRAAHPLYTLIDKKRTANFINTFIKQFEQGGRLPVWELSSNETDCMIGYHSVSVIADAMLKGIKGFDYQKAYEAVKYSAMLDHLGLEAYKRQGFIGIDDEHESVSKTLEYAYDDWCIAQMAQQLGHKEDFAYFMERSQYWKNLYNPETGFIQPKRNAGWDTPFDPKEVNNNYTEANGWQYTFFVPHDIQGLIKAMGGNQKFEAKLDEMFESVSETSGRHQVDITGLIGQYAHGNEPSHHFAYLYHFVDKPEKTAEKVHFILSEFYTTNPDGLIGNEDCGQMSAWYVLSALGIYNVCPSQPFWTTTTPFFDKAKVFLEDGTHREITKSNPPSFDLGFESIKSTSAIPFTEIVSVPLLSSVSRTFEDQISVTMHSFNGDEVYYATADPSESDNTSFIYIKYNKPIVLQDSKQVYVYAKKGEQTSKVVRAHFTKKPNAFQVISAPTPHPLYHANGFEALVDGVFGTTNWRKGDWMGFQDEYVAFIIDLGEMRSVQSITANFLQDTRAWILMPKVVEFWVSNDGIDFHLVGSKPTAVLPDDYNLQTERIAVSLQNKTARYIKLMATNFGALPDWHQGHPFDGKSYIFIDEIEVK